MLAAAAALTATALFAPVFPAGGGKRIIDGEKTVFYDISSDAPTHAAGNMALIDCASGRTLFARNENARAGMASTTKIMTALVVIENCDPADEVCVCAEAAGIEGSSVYLKPGEKLSVEELLYCMLLESGNDAAAALAIFCAGSTEAFAGMMNERAAELGLSDTHFTNPHGLSDPEHYTTARELALITRAAFEYPLFRKIAGTKRAEVPLYGVPGGRRLVNHNKLLFGFEGALGVKTGYTVNDGKCLVSAVERDGLLLICATLRDPFPVATHKALYEAAYEKYERVCAAKAGAIKTEIPVTGGERDRAAVSNALDREITLPRGAEFELEILAPEPVCAPVKKGEPLALARIVRGGETVDIIC